MASVLGVIGNSFLRRKNFLHEQIVNKIRKYAKIEISEQSSGLDQSNGIEETMSPLLNTDDLPQELCFRVRNEMINKHVIPEQAVDTRILDICLRARKPQIAKAYVNCLRNNGYSFNVYALARYLHLYDMEKPASSIEENEIIDIFEKIQKECEHVPLTIMKSCIIALCQTHKWRLSVDLIKDYPDSKEISNLIMLHIIPAAFRNKEISLGLKLLSELNDALGDPHRNSNIYKEYLNYYIQNEPTTLYMAIEKMFSFWRKYDVVPTKYVIDLFVNAYNNAGWEAKYVNIQQEGNCHCCNNHLSATTIDDKTSKKLANEIVAKTLVNTDIFQSTTPEELDKFKNFIHRTKPYDIVIDGLNVARGQRNIKWIKYFIDYFTKDKKKILIIARRHLYSMTKWVFPLDNVYIYYLDDVTNDDPYILYATLISGKDAKFVTYDLLRQHVHKLGDKNTQRKFKRWQYTHQYLSYYNNEKHKIELLEPWLFAPFAQYNNGYWHIPYRMDSEELKLLYKPVDTWICFRNPQK